MKRAEVARVSGRSWRVDVFSKPCRQPDIPIVERIQSPEYAYFATHAHALAHALAAVGLTENAEKETR